VASPAATAGSGRSARDIWALRAAAALMVVIVLEAVVGIARIGPDRSTHRVAKALTTTQGTLAATSKERDALKAEAAKLKIEVDDAKKTAAFQSTQATTFKQCVAAIKALGEAPDDISEAAFLELAKRIEKDCSAADRWL
jgi:hypothetical protein